MATEETVTLGLNALTHSLIIFSALTGLFFLVIVPTTQTAMRHEVIESLTKNLDTALEAANNSVNGHLRKVLKPVDPIFSVLESTVQRPDRATELFNRNLIQTSLLIISVFLTAIVVLIFVAKFGARLPVSRMIWSVVLSNVLIFSVIGTTEYIFFDRVAKKYVPVMPSRFLESLIKAVKNQF